jgi:hypothetical protein
VDDQPAIVTACCFAPWFVDPSAAPYDYEHEDGSIEACPVLRCASCGREIGGDRELLEVTP